MALKDIVVHVDAGAGSAARVEAAVALARDHEAHLTGFTVEPRIDFPFPPEVRIAGELIEAQRRVVEERARQARELFERVTGATNVASHWRSSEGELIDAMNLNARYADLLVAGPGEDRELGWMSDAVTDRVVIESGRPVLVIPECGTFTTIGKRIVIAWNASRESTRALHDGLEFAVGASEVTVMVIDPAGARDAGDGGRAEALARHLGRHGVAAEIFEAHSAKGGVGETLLARAADMRADLLVAGAYGHSRLRELALGGVTEHVFRHATLPVLMSH